MTLHSDGVRGRILFSFLFHRRPRYGDANTPGLISNFKNVVDKVGSNPGYRTDERVCSWGSTAGSPEADDGAIKAS